MITIYRWKLDDYPEALDPCAMFGLADLTGDDIERKMIREIEGGEYLDKFSFIDRFGYKIPRHFLSTGCKTALTVYHFQDRVINCIECGMNAIVSILRYCPDAHIILYDRPCGFETVLPAAAEIRFNNRVFTTLEEFSEYMVDRDAEVYI